MKDKFLACTSDLGLINGGESWENGCVLPGCKLNEPKLINILITGTKDGSNCHRELPGWLVALSDVDAAAFVYDHEVGKFELDKWNEPYFVMIARFGQLVNKYRGLLILDPYDICGVKNKSGKPKRTPFNPWTNNKQGIKGFWDERAKDYCQAWEDKLDKALKNVNWIPTIGNELDKRCIEQGKRTLLNFMSKKRFYFFKKHKVVYHGMLHNLSRTSPWGIWHKWQKKNWHLDEHVGEVWHLKGTIAKIKKMGNDHKEIPVEPRCFFSIDGINDQEMNIEDVLDILKPLVKTKDTGKSKMFFKKKPIIEVLNYSNKHITRALNRFHRLMFGVDLSNFGKIFDDAPPARPPDPASPAIEPPVDMPKERPTKPIILKPIIKKEVIMKNLFDFKGWFKWHTSGNAWAVSAIVLLFLIGLIVGALNIHW